MADRFVQPLEGRTLHAAPPGVLLSGRGTLLIQCADGGDNSVRLRSVRGNLEITFASGIALPGGVATPLTPGRGETVIAAATSNYDTRRSPVLTQKFVVAKSRFSVVRIEGGDRSDRMNFLAPGVSLSLNDVEAVTNVPAPAAAGSEPWTPALGKSAGSAAAWQRRLADQIAEANRSTANLAFFGDSHAERYRFTGRRDWNATFATAANFGLDGDTTRQALYRIQAGLFDRFKPKRLVVQIGSNNLNNHGTSGTDADIVRGINAVVTALREKLPRTKIILLGILPRRQPGMNPRVVSINASSAASAGGQGIYFVDASPSFVGEPLRQDVYVADDEHLNAKGYRVLTPYLTDLLKRL